MFVVQGAALLILKFPGGSVSGDFANLLVGDVIPEVLPVPILIIILAVLAWIYIKRLRFGIGLYAIGSDAGAARASRVDVRFIRFLSFVIAGAFFGAAGLFITANAGSGDPLIGAPFLLKVFTAVVLGGTLIGGGRGRRGRHCVWRAHTHHRGRHLSSHGCSDLLRADRRRRHSSNRGVGSGDPRRVTKSRQYQKLLDGWHSHAARLRADRGATQ